MIHADAERLLVAGAVLDDLAPDERAAYDAHRGTCAGCRLLERDLDAVLADLALIVPERAAPPGLLAGVWTAIGEATRPSATLTPVFGGAGAVVGSTTVTSTPSATTREARAPGRTGPVSRGTFGALALAAALGVVSVGLGVRSASLQGELDGAEAQVAQLRETLAADDPVVALAAAPDHVTVGLHAEPLAPAATASVLFRPGTEEAYLVAFGLPPTADGRVYQLWVADASGVHGLGTYAYDGSGPFVAPFGVDLDGAAAAMITLEPAGGATAEPGPQVVFGEL